LSINPATPLALTCGDPAGIGPDIILMLAPAMRRKLVIIGDREVLAERARILRIPLRLDSWSPGDGCTADPTALRVMHCPTNNQVVAGKPDPTAAPAILRSLDLAIEGCLSGDFSGMVTAPLSKQIICQGARENFTGHTEYLAKKTGTDKVVMMLVAQQLRVALVTTHLPLRQVAEQITAANLHTTILILHDGLSRWFGLAKPRILVLGLNPHAGEGGHLGREELDVIVPVITEAQQAGIDLQGPAPADTAFTADVTADYDAILAMYHDQGLPVLKYAGFGDSVNLTLGLPFIRTSVDHGTAFSLAGTGKASASSLTAAVTLAQELSGQPRQ